MFLLLPHAEVDVGPHVQEEFERMRFRFGVMLLEVMEELTKAAELDAIKKVLRLWNRDLKTKLDTVKTTEALIEIVRDNCSFTNYSIVTELAEHLNSDSALRKIKAYTEKRDEYYERVRAEEFAKVVMKRAESVSSGHIEVNSDLLLVFTSSPGPTNLMKGGPSNIRNKNCHLWT